MMVVAVAFACGVIVGWTALRMVIRWGVGRKDVQRDIFDRLGFEALVKFRDMADAEVKRRAGV